MEGGEHAQCLPYEDSLQQLWDVSRKHFPQDYENSGSCSLPSHHLWPPARLRVEPACPHADAARGRVADVGEAGVLLLCSVSLVSVPCVVHSCQCCAVCQPSPCCCVLWISAGTLIYELPVTEMCVQLLVLSFPSPACFPCSWNGTGPIKPAFVFSHVSSEQTTTGFGVFQGYGCLISKEAMFGKYHVCGSSGCCEEKHNNTIIKLGSRQSSAASSYCLLKTPEPAFLIAVLLERNKQKCVRNRKKI